MSQILNFDVVTYDFVDIVKNGTTYHLRDDVSMDIVAPLLSIMADMEALKSLKSGATNDQVVAGANSISDQGQRLTALVGDIFRHTLPDITDDEIKRTFSFDERLQLGQLFFSLAGKRYLPQPSDTPTPTNVVSMSSAKRRRRHH